jgi:CBS domain-containing protein
MFILFLLKKKHYKGADSMKVREVMTSSVDWVTPETSVVEIAKLMKKADVGSIPICKGNQLTGIITDRDIVLKVVATGKDTKNTTAQEIMTTDIKSVTSNQDVHEAADLMAKYQIRRLPVVEQGKLMGIVAIGDLAIEKIHINEAGDALSDISQGPAHH